LIKKTIVISNPAYLKKENQQLVIEKEEQKNSVPIEDIGVLYLDHWQITITQSVISAILANNGVVICSDEKHHPDGLMLPIEGNTIHAEILRAQIEAPEPLRKRLWQQTITAKINNQAAVCELNKIGAESLRHLAGKVLSGDTQNIEGQAAAKYWKMIIPPELEFTREREGPAPNNLLNYGYAIIRASVARALVCAGLHPAIGIHHHNRYNAFSLADDIMEPYRPCVDLIVLERMKEPGNLEELSKEAKARLLSVLTSDVLMEGERKPVQLAIGKTASSLVQCLNKESKLISYPEMYAPA
jgi:CRISPR-associated protein Cas1